MTSTHLNQTTFADRLRHAIKHADMTKTALANHVGVSRQAIQQLCTSHAKRSSYLYQIAEALDVNNRWLVTGEGHMRPEEDPIELRRQQQPRIPVLGEGEIQAWVKNPKTFTDMTHADWLSTEITLGKSAYAFKLIGHAMSPRFESGTVVIIDPTVEVEDRDYVMAYIAAQQVAVFRRLHLCGDTKTLQPTNHSLYKNLDLTPQDKLLGVMVQATLFFSHHRP